MITVTFDEIVGRLKDVQPYGRYVLARCEFHSDSDPSMLVFRDGWFRCLGCGRVGKLEVLWSKLNGVASTVTPEKKTSFRPPTYGHDLEELCYQAHCDLMQFPSFKWYLETRRLDDRIETNEIGYWQGWYSFPVRDEEGAFKTAVFRAAPHVQETTKLRYWCSSVPQMYVPDWFVVRRAKALFVVYGIMDALTLSSLRFPVVTSTAGNNTFHPEWLDSFRVPIYIIPDAGEETEAMKLANSLAWRGKVLRLNYPLGEKDPNGFLTSNSANDLVAQLGHYYERS